MKDILSEIVAHKREEINALKERMPVDKIYVNACYHPTASLRNALETSSHGIIAEFKRRSPSKGWIKREAKPSDIIPGYRKSGAAALSVLTDEKWLGFVLGQILSNALKYTKKGKISIYMSKSRPHTLVIEDTGIGIRAEDLPRVFEKGFTGYNGREENRSTGIGLYLCGKIMKRLDHGIRIESELGKGTKVFLELGRKKMDLY